MKQKLTLFIESVGMTRSAIAGFLFIIKLAEGQVPLFNWSHSFGGSGLDYGEVVHTDHCGNLYSAGRFSGSVMDMDPGPGVYTLSASAACAYALKLNSSGEFLWAIQFSGLTPTTTSGITDLKTDDGGNIYLMGYFSGIVDFDPGPATHTLGSVNSVLQTFLCKLSPVGGLIWCNAFGSGGNSFGELGLSGNCCYLTGGFTGTQDFDPGSGTFFMTSAGSTDIYILKLDLAGNFVWANQIGGPGQDDQGPMTVDPGGNLLFSGRFSGLVDFDPGPSIYTLTSAPSQFQCFICKLTPGGSFLWARQLGGPGIIEVGSLVCDQQGDVNVTGRFSSIADFDPGPGSFTLSATGVGESYVLKLDLQGNFLWA